MKILLRSGTVLTVDMDELAQWKAVMNGPDILVTYSTDDDGLIIFRNTDIDEILVSAEEVAESMLEPMPATSNN